MNSRLRAFDPSEANALLALLGTNFLNIRADRAKLFEYKVGYVFGHPMSPFATEAST